MRKTQTPDDDYVFDEYELGEPATPAAENESKTPDVPFSNNEVADEIQVSGNKRQGERRQNTQRRGGLRGEWEERRLFDRRAREYSMFGKSLKSSTDEAASEIAPIDEIPSKKSVDAENPAPETSN